MELWATAFVDLRELVLRAQLVTGPALRLVIFLKQARETLRGWWEERRRQCRDWEDGDGGREVQQQQVSTRV